MPRASSCCTANPSACLAALVEASPAPVSQHLPELRPARRLGPGQDGTFVLCFTSYVHARKLLDEAPLQADHAGQDIPATPIPTTLVGREGSAAPVYCRPARISAPKGRIVETTLWADRTHDSAVRHPDGP